MAEAAYVLVIARATGWSEHHIRWDLPLARGWAYYHAARLLDGEPMRWPSNDSDRITGWWQKVKAAFRRRRKG